MPNNLYMLYLGDNYCDVDVEYDVIEGDISVGLKEEYEFQVFYTDEDGKEVEITYELTEEENDEVIEAIKRDLERKSNEYY